MDKFIDFGPTHYALAIKVFLLQLMQLFKQVTRGYLPLATGVQQTAFSSLYLANPKAISVFSS